jgi:septum formation protein
VLLLASSSPYRRELLERLGIAFETASPAVDERPLPLESPRETALRLAELKARTLAALHPGRLVIGSDQVADLDGLPLGKPGSASAALEQLRAMRGRLVVFHTAVCLIEGASGKLHIDEVPTRVQLRNFSDAQAARYLAIDEPYDCAGSAKIEALGIALVESVESTDPTALIGLPLISVVSMLTRAGVSIL